MATSSRSIHVGGASREENIVVPGAALRSSPIQLMGSGIQSVPFPKLLESIKHVFEAAVPARLQIATTVIPLSEGEANWDSLGKPRIAFRSTGPCLAMYCQH
jgi:hypothetical protein